MTPSPTSTVPRNGPVIKRGDPVEAAEESRKAREMLAGNKLKRSESFIPLGSKGLMDHPRHQRETKYSKDFAAEPRYAQVRGGE